MPSLQRTIALVGQHFLTFCAVIATVWYVGRPHAQQFVEETVEERFETLEAQQQQLTDAIGELVRGQEAESRQSQFESQALGEVLCRLRAEENPRLDPNDCSR